MKSTTVIGILLIVLGIAGFAVGEFNFTHTKKDVDLGPVQIQHQVTRIVPVSPILSALALVGGIALVAVGTRSK